MNERFKQFCKAWDIEIFLFILALAILAISRLTACAKVIQQDGPAKHFFGVPADTSALLLWLVSIAVLGLGACTAASIFLPVKRLALAGAGGFGTILVLALTIKAALPFLPWVALAFAILGVAAGIVLFRRYVLGLHAAVAFGNDACNVVTKDELSRIKDAHAVRQLDLGVKTVIDTALSSIRTKGT